MAANGRQRRLVVQRNARVLLEFSTRGKYVMLAWRYNRSKERQVEGEGERKSPAEGVNALSYVVSAMLTVADVHQHAYLRMYEGPGTTSSQMPARREPAETIGML